MLRCARAVAAKLARIFLWANGLARRERDVPVVVVAEVEEEMAVERHVLRLVAHQAPVVAAELGVSMAPCTELPLAHAMRLEIVLRLLLPPGGQRVVKDPPVILEGGTREQPLALLDRMLHQLCHAYQAVVALGERLLHVLPPIAAVPRLVPAAIQCCELLGRVLLRRLPAAALALQPIGARHLALDRLFEGLDAHHPPAR
eukprot:6918618-Prymnesium_polylepis.1